MSTLPPSPPPEHEFEGDYRPANAANPSAHLDPVNVRVETADLNYLVRLADALNTAPKSPARSITARTEFSTSFGSSPNAK